MGVGLERLELRLKLARALAALGPVEQGLPSAHMLATSSATGCGRGVVALLLHRAGVGEDDRHAGRKTGGLPRRRARTNQPTA